MPKTLLMMPVLLLVFGMGLAYAEPLENTSVTVQNYDGISAIVEMEWNHDNAVTKYEVGCVSCSPNISESTSENRITLHNVTAFPNTSNAMLYLITYDSNDEIINAKQILVNLE